MAEIKISILDILGYQGKPVPNKVFRHSKKSIEAAILFPGLNYTCDMPLLYYLNRLLTDRHIDVLQLHTDYTGPEFQSLPSEKRFEWIAADAQAAVEALDDFGYTKLVLAGKSIGTLALAHLTTLPLKPAVCSIWLTPLLHHPILVEQASQLTYPSLFIASRDDPTFEENAIAYIQRKTGCETFLLEQGDHRLEVPGDLKQSLVILERILERVNAFLNQHAVQG